VMEAAWKEMQAWVEQEAHAASPPPTIRYYKSPSAFRRAGALTPAGLAYTYRLSPFMGCEQCDPEKNPYCFEHYNPWWRRGEIKVKTNTLALMKEVLGTGANTGAILVDGFDNLHTERETRVLRDCLAVLAHYPNRVHIQAHRPDLLVEYLPLLEALKDRLCVWVSIADDLAFQREMVLALADAGISVVLHVLLFPFINNSEEDLAELRRFAGEHRLGLAFTWLRLQHAGPQREVVLRWIEKRYGRAVAERYTALYPADQPAGKFGRAPPLPLPPHSSPP
jgi:DNA repair photolyase